VLKFSSGDPRSIIREGSGYWKYIPTPQGIRFLTWYVLYATVPIHALPLRQERRE